MVDSHGEEACDADNLSAANDVDVSEQMLLEKLPEVLHALLKDHTRTAHEVAKAKREGREAAMTA